MLRRQEKLRALPIIAMTANAMVGDRDKALAAGMNDQIGKPIKIDEMFATLVRWIRPEDPAHPGASSTTQADPLGSFPGIDVSTWRNSGLGDAKLYWRLLEMFLQQHCDFPAPFRAALAAGDLRSLRRLAHNLKSTAATLGAHGVERAATALEIACVAGAEAIHVQPLLDDLAHHLSPVLEGLQRWSASRPAAEGEARTGLGS
jgi:CheY-like chemotaxis protein